MASTSRSTVSPRSPRRKASARRAPSPRPPAAPVDEFAARLAKADAVARQMMRNGGLDPEAADGWPFKDAVTALARACPDYPAAEQVIEDAQRQQLLWAPTADTTFRPAEAALWTYESTRVEAAYLLGLAVGRRLAPGVPL